MASVLDLVRSVHDPILWKRVITYHAVNVLPEHFESCINLLSKGYDFRIIEFSVVHSFMDRLFEGIVNAQDTRSFCSQFKQIGMICKCNVDMLKQVSLWMDRMWKCKDMNLKAKVLNMMKMNELVYEGDSDLLATMAAMNVNISSVEDLGHIDPAELKNSLVSFEAILMRLPPQSESSIRFPFSSFLCRFVSIDFITYPLFSRNQGRAMRPTNAWHPRTRSPTTVSV